MSPSQVSSAPKKMKPSPTDGAASTNKTSPRAQASPASIPQRARATKTTRTVSMKHEDPSLKPHIVADIEGPETPTAASVSAATVYIQGTPIPLGKKPLSVKDDYYKKPFDYGWKREIVYSVFYISPSGKKLRTISDIAPLLEGDLTLDHFSFAREPLGVGPEFETVRSAQPYRPTVSAATLAVATAPSVHHEKHISESKIHKRASPGWTPTLAVEINDAALLYSAGSSKHSDSNSSTKPSSRTITGSINVKNSKTTRPTGSADAASLQTASHDPCSMTPCAQARGQIPQLQCIKCLFLYHHECVGLSRQYSEYHVVGEPAAPGARDYVCESCLPHVKKADAVKINTATSTAAAPAATFKSQRVNINTEISKGLQNTANVVDIVNKEVLSTTSTEANNNVVKATVCKLDKEVLPTISAESSPGWTPTLAVEMNNADLLYSAGSSKHSDSNSSTKPSSRNIAGKNSKTKWPTGNADATNLQPASHDPCSLIDSTVNVKTSPRRQLIKSPDVCLTEKEELHCSAPKKMKLSPDVAEFPVTFEDFCQYTNIMNLAVQIAKESKKRDRSDSVYRQKALYLYDRFYTKPIRRKHNPLVALKVLQCPEHIMLNIRKTGKYGRYENELPMSNYPVTLSLFLKCLDIDDAFKDYLLKSDKKLSDMQRTALRQDFNMYFFKLFYKMPCIRGELDFTFRSCPTSIKYKILQRVNVNTEISKGLQKTANVVDIVNKEVLSTTPTESNINIVKATVCKLDEEVLPTKSVESSRSILVVEMNNAALLNSAGCSKHSGSNPSTPPSSSTNTGSSNIKNSKTKRLTGSADAASLQTASHDPCSMTTCAQARGQIPQLQCVKCLCLYHHECVGLSRQQSEYHVVGEPAAPGARDYVCESCLPHVKKADAVKIKTVTSTAAAPAPAATFKSLYSKPPQEPAAVRAPPVNKLPQKIAVVKGKNGEAVMERHNQDFEQTNMSPSQVSSAPKKMKQSHTDAAASIIETPPRAQASPASIPPLFRATGTATTHLTKHEDPPLKPHIVADIEGPETPPRAQASPATTQPRARATKTARTVSMKHEDPPLKPHIVADIEGPEMPTAASVSAATVYIQGTPIPQSRQHSEYHVVDEPAAPGARDYVCESCLPHVKKADAVKINTATSKAAAPAATFKSQRVNINTEISKGLHNTANVVDIVNKEVLSTTSTEANNNVVKATVCKLDKEVLSTKSVQSNTDIVFDNDKKVLPTVSAESNIKVASETACEKSNLYVEDNDVSATKSTEPSIEVTKSTESSPTAAQQVANVFFRTYDRIYTFAYAVRRSRGLKRRILMAVLNMSLEDFCTYTRIYGGAELCDNTEFRKKSYTFVLKNEQIWPPILYMSLADLLEFLKRQNIAIDDIDLQNISPKLLHYEELMRITNFDEIVRLDYTKETAQHIDGDVDLLLNRRHSFYMRCWAHDEWLWETPKLNISLESIVQTQSSNETLCIVDTADIFCEIENQLATVDTIESRDGDDAPFSAESLRETLHTQESSMPSENDNDTDVFPLNQFVANRDIAKKEKLSQSNNCAGVNDVHKSIKSKYIVQTVPFNINGPVTHSASSLSSSSSSIQQRLQVQKTQQPLLPQLEEQNAAQRMMLRETGDLFVYAIEEGLDEESEEEWVVDVYFPNAAESDAYFNNRILE